jgi:hypothetical protein
MEQILPEGATLISVGEHYADKVPVYLVLEKSRIAVRYIGREGFYGRRFPKEQQDRALTLFLGLTEV